MVRRHKSFSGGRESEIVESVLQAACIRMSLRRKSNTVISVSRESASDTLEWSITSIGG